MNKKEIQERVKGFLKSNEKKIVLDVPENFSMYWLKSRFVVWPRKFIFFIQKWIIPSRFKNSLLRLFGLDIGFDVCLPHYISFDEFFPELVKVGKGSLIGGLSYLKNHELKDGKLTIGRINVAEKVLLAGWSTIKPGVDIGKYVITGMRCVVYNDIPEGEFWAGDPAILIKKWNKEEIGKYFADSKHDPDFYKKHRKITRDFRKNRNNMLIKIKNNGKRLNAGDEWYLARPWPRIYYNSFFVELARVCPFNWLRILLWRIMGAKIGKNCKIGKWTIFDHIYGDLAEIGDNVVIGTNGYVDGHSYTIAEAIYGRVKIADNVKFGDYVALACGLTVGKNSTVKDNSMINKDIGENEVWQGIPAKKIS